MKQIPSSQKQKRSVLSLNPITARNKSDRGDGNLISAILLLPMFFFLILTGVDMGFYFHNSNAVAESVRDGTRTAATYGHPGTSGKPSVIEKRHGAEWGEDQLQSYNDGRNTDPDNNSSILWASSGGDIQNSVEMQVAQQLENDSLYSIELRNINCDRDQQSGTENVRVGCDVQWRYSGIPGSVWTLITDRENNGWRVTSVSANSDVYLDEERGGVLANDRTDNSEPNGARGGMY